jgi:hypothetical protein
MTVGVLRTRRSPGGGVPVVATGPVRVVLVCGLPVVPVAPDGGAGGVVPEVAGGGAGAVAAGGGVVEPVAPVPPGEPSSPVSPTNARTSTTTAATATIATIAAGARQFGVGANRVRAGAPHSRHQSWSGAMAAPQRGHRAASGCGTAGGCSLTTPRRRGWAAR